MNDITVENQYVQFEHHGNLVWVREDLVAHNRDFCMCYDCARFQLNPATHVSSCPIAAALFAFDVLNKLVTPVFECPEFEPGERYVFTTEPGLP